MPILRVDAHFTVVESALKGYAKWRSSPRPQSAQEVNTAGDFGTNASRANKQQEQTATALEAEFEAWCGRLLETKVEVGEQSHLTGQRYVLLLILIRRTPSSGSESCNF